MGFIPIFGGLARTVGKKLIKPVIKGAVRVGKKVLKPSSLRKAGKAAVGAAVTGTVIGVIQKKTGGRPTSSGLPPEAEAGLPPELGGTAGGTGGVALGPREAGAPPIGGFGGGRGTSLIGQLVASGAIPLMTQVSARVVASVPPGYVKVKLPDGRVVGMLAQVAYALGIRKRPRRGAGISGRDLRAAKKVQRLVKRLTTGRRLKVPLKTAGRSSA